MSIILLLFAYAINAEAEIVESGISQIGELQRFRNQAKLYAPNFVLVGEPAEFRVFAAPNSDVTLTLDYGYGFERQVVEQKANELGVVTFKVQIINDKELIGKSFGVEATVFDPITQVKKKAILQNKTGTASAYGRIYIADNDSAKGVLFTPWKSLNQFIMNTSYDERSNYDPINDQIYDDTTPIYVRNMRDAQENVREVPRNINNSN